MSSCGPGEALQKGPSLPHVRPSHALPLISHSSHADPSLLLTPSRPLLPGLGRCCSLCSPRCRRALPSPAAGVCSLLPSAGCPLAHSPPLLPAPEPNHFLTPSSISASWSPSLPVPLTSMGAALCLFTAASQGLWQCWSRSRCPVSMCSTQEWENYAVRITCCVEGVREGGRREWQMRHGEGAWLQLGSRGGRCLVGFQIPAQN